LAFTASLPLPIPIPLPILSLLPFPLRILSSLPFPGPYLTALRFLLTLAVNIVNAMGRTAPSTAQCRGISPVLIIIIVVDYHIPIQWSTTQEVIWIVLPAAWRLNLCLEIITTVRRGTLTGAFTVRQAGCLWIGAIFLIPEGMGVVLPVIVHLEVGFIKHLPDI
jgi:hypothetical protein